MPPRLNFPLRPTWVSKAKNSSILRGVATVSAREAIPGADRHDELILTGRYILSRWCTEDVASGKDYGISPGKRAR